MGSYTAIADVGSSIIKLLREHMTPEPIQKKDMIGLCSPVDRGDYKLGLYLYDIQENGDFRPMAMKNIGMDKQKYPPLSVTLYYMLTAYSNADIKSKAIDEHRMMGRAMQILYDNATLDSSKLVGTLGNNNETVEIVLNNMKHEEKIRLWNFPNQPYRLSMFYKVAPVYIESTRIKQIKRVLDVDITLQG
ncbi:DUF4255 domain-containing protein [Crassaminicella profunda]|uniref:DUF4255 domain-containing protein n=1 Tax=Crassaminicella profunda TaxID=1286698 RepID=UPI001CA60CC4|nr:DUF4255 domain-containing protein [Crassaminicella profunda]QZY54461.1 DUF4255 domain-containing protein [Crassaminicella profunda]